MARAEIAEACKIFRVALCLDPYRLTQNSATRLALRIEHRVAILHEPHNPLRMLAGWLNITDHRIGIRNYFAVVSSA